MIKGTTVETAADLRPWRKRHPVLSRAVLYTLGLALGTLLVVLWNQRKDEDRVTELEAIQKQIDGLGLVLAADPTGEELLTILDERFAGDDLPLKARERSLRWRVMGLRRRAQSAPDEAARDAAYAEADAVVERIGAMDLPADARYAFRLEHAETLLERRDTKGARDVLPSVESATVVSHALLRQFLLAQLLRLEGQPGRACDLLRDTLKQVDAPLSADIDAYVGGREWTPREIALEMAGFVTTQDGRPEDASLWSRVRRLAGGDYEAQKAAARGLSVLGADDDALAAWRTACRLDPRLSGLEAERDPVLGGLQKQLETR